MNNKQVIESMLAELSKGNADGFLNALANDVVFTIVGTTRFSGTLRGKQEVVEKLLAPLGAALDGGIALDVERLIAEGDTVVCLSRGRAKAKSGKPYCNTYCHIFRLAGGKVVEVREYFDTALTDNVLR